MFLKACIICVCVYVDGLDKKQKKVYSSPPTEFLTQRQTAIVIIHGVCMCLCVCA